MKRTAAERQQLREELEAEIANQRARLASMTPADRQDAHRAELARQQEATERSGRLDQAGVTAAMEVIEAAFQGLKPTSQADMAHYRWTQAQADLAALGVPARHQIKIVDWHNEPQRKTFELVKRHCRRQGAVIALCGERGTGKTTIACQVMRERVEDLVRWRYSDDSVRGPEPDWECRYEKLSRLGTMLKPLFASFGSIQQERLASIYDAWCRLPLVVLDELHDAEAIGPAMSLLVDLIDRRYAARRDTILISNRSAEEFQREMNPSIVSRIGENGAVLDCRWASMRTRK